MVLLATMIAAVLTQESMHTITSVTWAQRPEGTEAPYVATLMGLAGRVTVSCVVERDGPPTDCRVVEALPEGAGFEAAALATAQTGRFTAATVDGQPVRQSTRFEIRFDAAPVEDVDDRVVADPSRVARARKLIDALAGELGHKTSAAFLSDVFGGPISDPDRAQVDVGEDRVDQVRLWMDDLGIGESRSDLFHLAEAVADNFTDEELSSVRNVQDFRRAMAIVAARSDGNVDSLRYRRSGRELRRRYCERYDCRQPDSAS